MYILFGILILSLIILIIKIINIMIIILRDNPHDKR
jgi:hypothetical protein